MKDQPTRTGLAPRAEGERPSRRFRDRLGRGSTPPPPAVWPHCGAIGLACGLAESGLGLGWRWFGPRVHDPDLWVNWNAPWMAPPAMAGLFAGVGLLAGLFRGLAPRLTTRLLPAALLGIGARGALGALPGLDGRAAALLALGLAVRLGGRARPGSEACRRALRRLLPAAAVAWLGLFVAYGVLPATREARGLAFGPSPRPGAPNVLLVVLDTVRADSLSLHGYVRPTTPRLAEWARRGVTFDQARATTPFTLGTHASLFTGCWMSRTSARVDAPLDGARPTLAEHLRDRGYATAGFVGNIFYGSAHYGLDRGFLRYHDVPGDITRRVTPRELLRSCRLGARLVAWFERKWRILAPMQRRRLDADELNREALAWIDRTRPRGRPFFLLLNLFDAHGPYTLPGDAPQPFSRRPAERLEARMKRLADLEDHPVRAKPGELAALRAEVRGDLRDAYDDGIAWVDRKLDELLRALDRRGLLTNTLVVVTSDHGEMLGEHGLIGHGNTLRRPVVHVPLLILGARGMGVPAGVRVDRPVSLRDVPATVLDLLDDPAPDRFPGRSLARTWTAPESDPADDPVLSEMQHMPWLPHAPHRPAAFGPMWLLTEGRWSYHRQEHDARGTVERLYDLAADPGESHDLATDPAHAATLAAFRDRLARAIAAD